MIVMTATIYFDIKLAYIVVTMEESDLESIVSATLSDTTFGP